MASTTRGGADTGAPDLTPLLNPRSIAVIGAGVDPHTLRGRIMAVMGRHAYAGEVYPVSRSESEILGRKAYPSIAEVPGPVDLAVIIIPARFVPQVLDDCGKAGVRAAQIITSGFAEQVGEDGPAMQRQIADIARRHGMAVCGPNAEGFVNTRARLCPTFSPAVDFDGELRPAQANLGAVAVVAQSGGIGFAFYDRARDRELPFSYVVTTGNEACLQAADVIDWLIDDDDTDVIILFVETVGDAARFRQVAARALTAGKPIVTVKIGRSEAGARAALSHTAAITGAYAGFRAIAERYGLIEVDDIDEAVELAAGFAAWRGCRADGTRVGIFTASGGAGGWMADACAAAGLEVPALDATTRAKIDPHLPAYGSSQNPVDATAQAIGALGYAGLVETVASAPEIDMVVAIASARTPTRLENDRDALIACRRNTIKPVAFWSYTQPDPRSVRILAEAGFPLFTSLRNCARALHEFATLQRLQAGAEGPAVAAAELTAERQQVRQALRDGPARWCEYQVTPLLAAYGIAGPAGRLATTADEAATGFLTANGPVALKLQSPDLLHKSDHDLVRLDVGDDDAVRQGFGELMARAGAVAPNADVHGVLVQPMAPPGLELILGLSRDATFGPLLTVGLGGIHAEVLGDSVTLPLPLSASVARAGLERLKGRALLDGLRGQPPRDVDALVSLMLRLSDLARDHGGQIAELDLNPVLLHAAGEGLSVVDALLVTGAD